MKRLFQIAVTLLTISGLTVPNQAAAFADKKIGDGHIALTVQSSPDSAFATRLELNSYAMMESLLRAKKETGIKEPVFTDIYIRIMKDRREQRFRLERSGNLWNEEGSYRYILPKKGAASLLKTAQMLRSSHYGELLPWEEARHLVPYKGKFSITDLETGLSFDVQRRAGKDHADVQPLTKKDTETMKQIYGGRWSWNRKAILVHNGGRWLAASMNGMPHGGDGIPDNDFSGHFCVHFYQSTTHRSDHPDLGHQLMVHKAAGKLRQFFHSSSPLELAESFVEAMNHREYTMLSEMAEGMAEDRLDHYVQEARSIVSIRIVRKPENLNTDANANDRSGALSEEIELPVTLSRKNGTEQTVYRYLFIRESMLSPWRIADIIRNGEENRSRTESGDR